MGAYASMKCTIKYILLKKDYWVHFNALCDGFIGPGISSPKHLHLKKNSEVANSKYLLHGGRGFGPNYGRMAEKKTLLYFDPRHSRSRE